MEGNNFTGKKLPKNSHVLQFVHSLTSDHKNSVSKKEAIFKLAVTVHNIWVKADCPPKSKSNIVKAFERLEKDTRMLKKKNKKNEIRKLDEEFFDVLRDEKFRQNMTFDEKFYNDQKTSYHLQIEVGVNSEFLVEEVEKSIKTQKQRFRRENQKANFKMASLAELDQVISQVCINHSKQTCKKSWILGS